MFPHSIQLQARLESQKSPFHMSSRPCYAPNTHEPKSNNTRFKTFILEAFSYDLILFLYFHHQIIFVYLDGSHFAILHTKLYDLGPNIQSTIVTYNTDCHHNNKLFRFFTTGLILYFQIETFFYKMIYLVQVYHRDNIPLLHILQ